MSDPDPSLPEGWTRVPLGHLVRPAGSQIEPRLTPDADFTYLGLEDIEAGSGRILDLRPTPGREMASAKSRFQKGDLLYGRLRPYLQKVVIAPTDGIAATELVVLRPDAGQVFDIDYLQAVLLGPDHLEQVSRLMSGARMPRVRVDQLLNLPIALPPLETQHRFARALTVLRHRIHDLRERTREASGLADRLERGLLDAAFDGRLSAEFRRRSPVQTDEGPLAQLAERRRSAWERATQTANATFRRQLGRYYPEPDAPDAADRSAGLPDGWTWASLSELTSAVDPLRYGVVEPGEDVDRGVPLVRVQDLEDGEIVPNRMRRISAAVDRRHARSRLQGGEVLVSLVGSIGRVARVAPELAGANIARALAKATPVEAGLSDWLEMTLRSARLQDWLSGSARGVARNTLNLSRLARAPIPLAPEAERVWIMEQVCRRQTAATALKARLEAITTELDNLWAIVRSRALSGRAALDDPGDEAVELARAAQVPLREGRREGTRGKGKAVSAMVINARDPDDRRDLAEVLAEHPEGLDPLRLLEETGYGLSDVEVFYKVLARAVADRRVREQRTEADWPVLVTI
jgi:type I restriction enzyme S subunit